MAFLFGPEVWPENIQFEELLNSTSQSDVIIIFNSGGWGNTPLEEAKDFAPIIEGIQEILKEWGYNSLVIPYTRAKDDLSGKITGARDFLNSFQFLKIKFVNYAKRKTFYWHLGLGLRSLGRNFLS